jgi:hypothetical protein
MDEIKIETVTWTAPEYMHKDHSNDWFWTIGLIALVGCIIAIWFESYVFAIFIFISGVSLIMFTVKQPRIFKFTMDSKGIKVDNEKFQWENLKSFNIKEVDTGDFNKLMIETNKSFLPIYTFLIPKEKMGIIKKEVIKIIKKSEIDESRTIQFAEKIGF